MLLQVLKCVKSMLGGHYCLDPVSSKPASSVNNNMDSDTCLFIKCFGCCVNSFEPFLGIFSLYINIHIPDEGCIVHGVHCESYLEKVT